MKKKVVIIVCSLAVVFTLFASLYFVPKKSNNYTVRQMSEIVITGEVVDTTDEETGETEETDDLGAWSDNEVMPFIVTALGGLTGTGVISFILAFFLKKTKNSAAEAINSASEALKLTVEQNNELKETVDTYLDTITNTLKDYIDSTLKETIESMNISAQEINESKKRQEDIANRVIECIKEINGDADETTE